MISYPENLQKKINVIKFLECALGFVIVKITVVEILLSYNCNKFSCFRHASEILPVQGQFVVTIVVKSVIGKSVICSLHR